MLCCIRCCPEVRQGQKYFEIFILKPSDVGELENISKILICSDRSPSSYFALPSFTMEIFHLYVFMRLLP